MTIYVARWSSSIFSPPDAPPVGGNTLLRWRLREDGRIKLVGINYKDNPENVGHFSMPTAILLQRSGPRHQEGLRWTGRLRSPETFVVDLSGRIVFKHVGPVDENSLKNEGRAVSGEFPCQSGKLTDGCSASVRSGKPPRAGFSGRSRAGRRVAVEMDYQSWL